MKHPAPVVALLMRAKATNMRQRIELKARDHRYAALEQRLAASKTRERQAVEDLELVLRMCPDPDAALAMIRDRHRIRNKPEYHGPRCTP